VKDSSPWNQEACLLPTDSPFPLPPSLHPSHPGTTLANNLLTPGPPSITKFAFTMVEWARDPENAKSWRRIMARDGLTHDPFADVEGAFTFADTAYVKFGPLGMNKVRARPE